MQRKILRTIAVASFALVVGFGAAGQARAQDGKAAYPNMAPLAVRRSHARRTA